LQLQTKVVLALAGYAAIAALAWRTLTDLRLREFVWVMMAFFAFKTVMFWFRERGRE
jgi:hypothetical protein